MDLEVIYMTIVGPAKTIISTSELVDFAKKHKIIRIDKK